MGIIDYIPWEYMTFKRTASGDTSFVEQVKLS